MKKNNNNNCIMDSNFEFLPILIPNNLLEDFSSLIKQHFIMSVDQKNHKIMILSKTENTNNIPIRYTTKKCTSNEYIIQFIEQILQKTSTPMNVLEIIKSLKNEYSIIITKKEINRLLYYGGSQLILKFQNNNTTKPLWYSSNTLNNTTTINNNNNTTTTTTTTIKENKVDYIQKQKYTNDESTNYVGLLNELAQKSNNKTPQYILKYGLNLNARTHVNNNMSSNCYYYQIVYNDKNYVGDISFSKKVAKQNAASKCLSKQ